MQVAGADARPRSRKAAGLLAFLAIAEDGSASRTRLADLLWSDRGEDQARSSLRQVILELKASPAGKAGAILITRDTVGYAANAIRTEIDDIRAAAAARDAPLLAALLEQVRGRILEDLDGLSPAFDEWLQAERARQDEDLFATVLAAMPGVMESAEAADAQRVLGALERLDPLNEPVVRLRLRLDHAMGDVAAMHRRYRRLADDLSRDLGIAPSSATAKLLDDLLGRTSKAEAPEIVEAKPAEPAAATRTPPAVLVEPLIANGAAESGDIAAICTADIRTALSQNSELRVLMIDREDEARLHAVAANAIAAYRLSGSIRTIGNQTSVNIELGNIETGLITWSDKIRFTGASFDLVDQIVPRVVGAVGPAIERDLSASLDGPSTASDATREAALLYARGRHLARDAHSLAALNEAVDLLKAALRQDQRHVGARIRLSNLYNTDFSFLMAGHDVADFREQARLLIEEAVRLDPGNIRVQIRLAWCSLRRGEWTAAERLFRQAIEVMPYDADALNECAFGLACMGELDLARPLMQRAFQLNPFAPNEYHADHAVLLTLAGEMRDAEEHFQICGDRRLFYQAIRLGNLLRLEPEGTRLRSLQRHFVEEFRTIWQPKREPELSDLSDWVEQSLCLRRPEHRQLVTDGVSAAWLLWSPAALGMDA